VILAILAALTFDWTINLTAILLAIITVGLVPLIKLLGSTLFEVRDSLRDLKQAVGTWDPPEGLRGDVGRLRHEQHKHRNWIIQVYQHVKLPWSDRT